MGKISGKGTWKGSDKGLGRVQARIQERVCARVWARVWPGVWVRFGQCLKKSAGNIGQGFSGYKLFGLTFFVDFLVPA